MNLFGLPWNALNPLEPQYWLPPRDSNVLNLNELHTEMALVPPFSTPTISWMELNQIARFGTAFTYHVGTRIQYSALPNSMIFLFAKRNRDLCRDTLALLGFQRSPWGTRKIT